MPEHDTLVFIPAWNEEDNIAAVLDELRSGLPVDRRPRRRRRLDGRDGGGCARPRSRGSLVRRQPRPARRDRRRLRLRRRARIRAGRSGRRRRPASGRRARASARDREERAGRRRRRVALRDRRGLRGVPLRAVLEQETRHVGASPRDANRSRTPVPRRDERDVCGEPAGDASARLPYTSRAPEVESLLRLREAGLDVVEVPVHMRERASGESKLRGSKAVKLVLTVAGTLIAYGVWRRVRRRG